MFSHLFDWSLSDALIAEFIAIVVEGGELYILVPISLIGLLGVFAMWVGSCVLLELFYKRFGQSYSFEGISSFFFIWHNLFCFSKSSGLATLKLSFLGTICESSLVAEEFLCLSLTVIPRSFLASSRFFSSH